MKNSTSKNKIIKDAEANVLKAKKNLNEARVGSLNEYEKYKATLETKLSENKRKIADLKKKIKAEGPDTRTKYEKLLEELDQQNEKLKTRMQEYKEGAKEKWVLFKKSFNEAMDDLGKSISEMAEKNLEKTKNLKK
jgi:DNA anti-recombination protein RmuC